MPRWRTGSPRTDKADLLRAVVLAHHAGEVEIPDSMRVSLERYSDLRIFHVDILPGTGGPGVVITVGRKNDSQG